MNSSRLKTLRFFLVPEKLFIQKRNCSGRMAHFTINDDIKIHGNSNCGLVKTCAYNHLISRETSFLILISSKPRKQNNFQSMLLLNVYKTKVAMFFWSQSGFLNSFIYVFISCLSIITIYQNLQASGLKQQLNVRKE